MFACCGHVSGDKRRFRPHWLDLGVLAFVALPVASATANGFAGWDFSVNQVWDRFAGWMMPYLTGRLYFGHGEGVRRVSAAVVFGGLAYVPFCIYEGLVGPDWYLAHSLYGKTLDAGQTFRVGGYRPEVFLWYGGELAAWMALSAVMAFWLALGSDAWWPPRRRVPAWVPAVVLALTSLYCRGVYGYILLAVGIGTALLMRVFRSPWPLALLLLVAPAYTAARTAGHRQPPPECREPVHRQGQGA